MSRRSFTVAAGHWEQLVRLQQRLTRYFAEHEQKKAAEARFQTDFDGCSEDRFHDQGVVTV